MRVTSFERDGLTFDVRDEGPIDGEPIVLLHGFPETSTCWRDVAPLLHAKGYRTVAPDQRGYSPGARPGRRRDYRVSELAGDASALIDELGGRAHVVGHDWGAIVAWALTGMRPEQVTTLTAVSVPHPRAFLASLPRSKQLLRSWYMFSFLLPRIPERLAGREGGVFDRGLDDSGKPDIDRFRTEVYDAGALPGGLGYYRAMPLVDRALLPGPIDVPTSLVWTTDDAHLDRKGVELTERYVRGPYALTILPGTHWLPVENPIALAEAIVDRVAAERTA